MRTVTGMTIAAITKIASLTTSQTLGLHLRIHKYKANKPSPIKIGPPVKPVGQQPPNSVVTSPTPKRIRQKNFSIQPQTHFRQSGKKAKRPSAMKPTSRSNVASVARLEEHAEISAPRAEQERRTSKAKAI